MKETRGIGFPTLCEPHSTRSWMPSSMGTMNFASIRGVELVVSQKGGPAGRRRTALEVEKRWPAN